ncbi:cyclase family protein [Peptococcus simiae]|uniref:cyclase family protein n=1 Tax=Peptococcus simiae TaxID=1643805 RepID=UPI0039803D98
MKNEMNHSDRSLWTLCEELKKHRFVELSYPLSPESPHWSGFSPMIDETLFTYADGFFVNKFQLVSQYGTHVDAPIHFVENQRALDKIGAEEMILPLCVIDVSDKVARDVDYAATVQDILSWEATNGPIPKASFVALRTDWCKREDKDNRDAEGNKHYPGWSLDAIKYLVEKRNVTAIGHESSDTDPPVVSSQVGYVGETYILDQGRYQIELMRNLYELPAVGALIVCGFPMVVGGAGFTARCFAICP